MPLIITKFPSAFAAKWPAIPCWLPLLLGLGVDELSAAPPLVPPLKFLIRRLKMSEAKQLADFALECESGAEILTRCQELSRQIAPRPV